MITVAAMIVLGKYILVIPSQYDGRYAHRTLTPTPLPAGEGLLPLRYSANQVVLLICKERSTWTPAFAGVTTCPGIH
ncbi:MAG: hypothetical protein CVV12_00335 [Gammaproteobacteria bacterium HGW-Gammaproteobacteria-2]|nr:MAG: hypothetical protein CVV12_00335 [Gammaproteobacteria bacterium HGW-Gammaproteobacteria-2]